MAVLRERQPALKVEFPECAPEKPRTRSIDTVAVIRGEATSAQV